MPRPMKFKIGDLVVADSNRLTCEVVGVTPAVDPGKHAKYRLKVLEAPEHEIIRRSDQLEAV